MKKTTILITATMLGLFSIPVKGQYISADWIPDGANVQTRTEGDCSIDGRLFVVQTANLWSDCIIRGPLTVQSGLIYLEPTSGVDIPRNISARSTFTGININSGSSYFDGSQISINAINNGFPTPYAPGEITFTSNITNNLPGATFCPAFVFQTIDSTGVGEAGIHSGLLTISNTGWIGMNSNTPSAELEVNGNVIIDTNLTVNDSETIAGNLAVGGGKISMVTTTDMQRNISAGSTISGININSGSGTIDGSVISINALQNTLSGQITLTSNISNPAALPVCPAFAFQTTDGTTHGTHSNLVTISNTGWMGINVVTSAAQLEVNGNALIDTNLTVSGNATLNDLTVTGNETIDHNLTVDGDGTIDHHLAVGVDATIGRDLTVGSGQLYMTIPFAPDAGWRNLSAGSENYGININARYGNDDGSSIWIGGLTSSTNGQIALKAIPTSPATPAFAFQISLHPYPLAVYTTPFAIFDNGQASLSASGYNPLIAGITEQLTLENGLYLYQSTDAADRIIAGRTATGLVGIFSGDDDLTSSPYYTHDSTPYASGSSVVINGINNATAPGQVTITANTKNNPIATPVGPAFAFQTNDGSATSPNLVTISNAGYLGVNTATPGAPLDVNGNALVENNLTVGGDLTIDNDFIVDGNETIKGNLTVQGGLISMLTSPADIDRNISAYSIYHGFNINSCTNVADGSAIALNAIDNFFIPGQITLTANIANNPVSVPICPAFNFQIADAGRSITSNVVTISNRGYLGVNTATPGSALDVNGNGTIESNFNVEGHQTVGDYLTVGSYETIAGNLTVGGNGTIDNNLIVDNNLTVTGGQISMLTTTDIQRNVTAGSTTAGININSGTDYTNGSVIAIKAVNNTATPGQIALTANTSGISTEGPGCTSTAYAFQAFDGTTLTTPMEITNDGRVVIGNDLASGCNWHTSYQYNLYVSKGILTEKLKVANSTDVPNWSDYVFNKDYKLMPIRELEAFVKTNKHLPEIPTAGDVAKDGIDVADMDAKLLQKIEELTLYVLAQQKQIDEQQKEMRELKKQINNTNK